MRNKQQLLIACHFGSISHDDIHQFIDSVLEGEEEYDSMVFDAYSRDIFTSRRNLEEYLRKCLPIFEIQSDEGINVCRRELKHQLERLKQNECSQEEFCDFFNRLESELVLTHNLSIDFFGDLYNACDCFDSNWKFLPSQYLEDESTRVLELINQAEQVAT